MYKKNIIRSFIIIVLIGCVGCQTRNKHGNVALSRLTNGYWQIWTIRSDGGQLQQITASSSDKRYPTWSKDGKSILYRTNNNKAYMVDPVTGTEHAMLESYGRVSNPIESPADCSYLFVRIGTQMKDTGDIWIVSRDGKERRILARNIGLQCAPAWSPDGKKVAYISGYGNQPRELSIIDVNSMISHTITSNTAVEMLPAYSSDGKFIVYVSNLTGNPEIWKFDVVTGKSTQLTFDLNLNTRPCWSPDGKKIMFVSSRSGTMQLWMMNPDGSCLKQFTIDAESIDPAWKKE